MSVHFAEMYKVLYMSDIRHPLERTDMMNYVTATDEL